MMKIEQFERLMMRVAKPSKSVIDYDDFLVQDNKSPIDIKALELAENWEYATSYDQEDLQGIDTRNSSVNI
jgi:hypothetical protein